MDTERVRFVEIYRAANVSEAHAARLALESAGIRARVEGEVLQGAMGELPLGWSTSPRIIVAIEDADNAREILKQALP